MKQQKLAQTVLIRDPRAVAIINERAKRENRSRANCASTIIIETSCSNSKAQSRKKQEKLDIEMETKQKKSEGDNGKN